MDKGILMKLVTLPRPVHTDDIQKVTGSKVKVKVSRDREHVNLTAPGPSEGF